MHRTWLYACAGKPFAVAQALTYIHEHTDTNRGLCQKHNTIDYHFKLEQEKLQDFFNETKLIDLQFQ